jgi:glycosyltransferase involved in cell wall biosynthesis
LSAAAVECWRRQTWQNTELLVLDDAECPAFPAEAAKAARFCGGDATEMAAIGAAVGCGGIQAANWPDGSTQDSGATGTAKIHYFCLPKRLTIGAKRNLGCLLAHGEYVAHVDSDDWSASNRLANQMATLQRTGKQVAGYHSMLFTDGTNFWRYCGAIFNGSAFSDRTPGAFGTSLIYRKDWWEKHHFLDGPLNNSDYEDRAFVMQAIHDGAIVSVPAGDMMMARVHADNTSPKNPSGERWKAIRDTALIQQYRAMLIQVRGSREHS